MKYVIKPVGHPLFQLTNEIPESLSDHHIPGSTIYSAVGSFGAMLLQQVEINNYCWQYVMLETKEDTSFHESYTDPVTMSLLVLTGEFTYGPSGSANIYLTENQFTVGHFPSYVNTLHTEKGKRYMYLRMIYPKDYVSYVLSFYPAFEVFKKNMHKTKRAFLANAPAYADVKMLDEVHQLLHSFYSANVQALHLTILRNVLTRMIELLNEGNVKKTDFSLRYIEQIHAARDFINLHLPEHFSIGQIAHKVGINEQKLKQGFKEVYGTGVYTYLRKQILEITRIQLEETNKPIKEIAFNAGYKSQGNFSSAFKKNYGRTPVMWRLHAAQKNS